MRSRPTFLLNILLLALAVPVAAQQPPVDQLPYPTTPWRPLPPASPALATGDTTLNSSSWTAIGPAPLQGGIPFSGRIAGIAAHPADANIIYIAAAGGGVWKTINGGSAWSSLTDDQETLSVGV
jgi:hypothetical protein